MSGNIAAALIATVLCISTSKAQNILGSNDLVRIIAYDFNAKGNRVVYVEQRNQNEEPQAKYLYSPLFHPVVKPPQPNIIDVPAPRSPHPMHVGGPPHPSSPLHVPIHSPAIQMQPVPNIISVPAHKPAPATPVRHMAPPVAPRLPVAPPSPPRQPAPQPPAPNYSGFFSHGLFKRQVVPPGSLMSPPVSCKQVYAVPSSAQHIANRDTDLYACEIHSPVMSGTFTVQNEQTTICFTNFDAVQFESRTSHRALCE